MKMIPDGFVMKREDRSRKDLFIQFIDYSRGNQNIYRFVNQLEITRNHTRIPDEIAYINGIPGDL